MAKKDKKKQYNLRKERSKGTFIAVISSLEYISTEEIIQNIYIEPENDFEKWLIREIEKQLILAKIDSEKFKNNLYQFFKQTASKIKKGNWIRDFYNFTYKAYVLLDNKFDDKKIAISVAYYDILVELSTYFAKEGNFVIGVDDNKVLEKIELYPFIDKYFLEVFENVIINNKKDKFEEMLSQRFKKLGYDISGIIDYEEMLRVEKIITNMYFCMSFLIDNDYKEFILDKYIELTSDAIKVNPTASLETIMGALKERKRLLPKKGIYITNIPFSNIEEVYLREKFANNSLFLMYRIKIGDGYLIGYYDVISQFFYSVFNDSNALMMHIKLKAFILEIYANLTTDINTMNNINCYIEDTNKIRERNERGTSFRKYNKDDYEEVKKYVEAYVRKLPPNYKASDEAREFARKYGIILAPDETFVRPFEKTVRKKDT